VDVRFVRMGPPFLSHEVPPFGKGHATPGLGDLLTMVISHLQVSWDDPPSGLYLDWCFFEDLM